MGNLCTEMMADTGTLSAWVGAIAFTLQLYFDFSGYSDMARGLGRMLGFEFLPNFNYPYISRSVTEFWRRWHISLSTWFKEYVYIPLGGNRKGMARQILNIAIVWALTGFWHGASWNFLLWGLYYAVLLIFEKTVWLKLLQKLPRFVGHIYTIFVFTMGWVLFYFTDFGQLGTFLARLFAGTPTQQSTGNLILGFLPLTAVAIFASTPAMKLLQEKYAEKPAVRYGCIAAAAVAMILCVAALASQSYNPFIYFRF
jgi:alginate O-acetyltransferase complex protein AlgI